MLRWNYNHKVGRITFTEQRTGNKFTNELFECNALMCEVYLYKDDEGKEMAQLSDFFLDEKHVNRIKKNNESIFPYRKVNKIELNLYYPTAKTLLRIFTKEGYKVTCYYKEPKDK